MDESAYIQSQQTTYILPRKHGAKRKRELEANEKLVSGEGRRLPQSQPPFLKLLAGEEPTEYTRLRYKLYSEMITRQDATAEKILREISMQTLQDISSVMERPIGDGLDTVLLLSNSSVATSAVFLNQLKSFVAGKSHHKLVTLNSKEATTMRLALKSIVGGLVSTRSNNEAGVQGLDDDEYDDDDDDDEEDTIKTYDKRIPWDLEVAQEWCEKFWKSEGTNIQTSDLRVVLVFEDIDSLNVTLLNRLIKLIHSFRGRIPIKLVFNIGTNAKSFASKLSNDVIQYLNFSRFKIEQTDNIINRIVTDIVIPETYLIGEDLAKFILDRFRMSVKNVDEFLRILKYAKMTFFFNSPLIVLPYVLSQYSVNNDLCEDYYTALRMLPSFKRYISVMMDKNVPASKIDDLLMKNTSLADALIKATRLYSSYADGFKAILKLITKILAKRSFKTTKNYLDFYYKLSSKDEFVRLQFINEMMSLMKTIEIDSISDMVNEIGQLSTTTAVIKPLHVQLIAKLDLNGLQDLIQKGTIGSLSGADQLNYKIESRKLKDDFLCILDSFLRSNISSPDRIVFNELFRINDADIVKQNLVPPTRAIIQESLINHEKYIGLSNTGNDTFDRLNNTMNPVITELFAIYRETNLNLNIYDYYTTFRESLEKDVIMRDINTILDDHGKIFEHYLNDELRFKFIYQFFNNTDLSDDEKWNRLTLTFFLQKCEEMIRCGFFKQVKKKGETLEKAIWKDL